LTARETTTRATRATEHPVTIGPQLDQGAVRKAPGTDFVWHGFLQCVALHEKRLEVRQSAQFGGQCPRQGIGLEGEVLQLRQESQFGWDRPSYSRGTQGQTRQTRPQQPDFRGNGAAIQRGGIHPQNHHRCHVGKEG